MPRKKKETKSDELEKLENNLKILENKTESTEQIIIQNLKQAAVVVALVLFGMYLFNQMKENRAQALAEASQKFSFFQRTFEVTEKSSEEAVSNETQHNQLRALSDSIKVLEGEYSQGAYGQFAKAYSVKVASLSGDESLALQKYAEFTKGSPNYAEDLTAASFARELLRLAYGSELLTKDEGAGKAILFSLIKEGRFTNIDAALALYKTVKTEAEKLQVIDEIKALQLAHPEFSPFAATEFGL